MFNQNQMYGIFDQNTIQQQYKRLQQQQYHNDEVFENRK